jgi:hypothetical protein
MVIKTQFSDLKNSTMQRFEDALTKWLYNFVILLHYNVAVAVRTYYDTFVFARLALS